MSKAEHDRLTTMMTKILGAGVDKERIAMCANAAITICHWSQPTTPPEVKNFGDDVISQRTGASFLEIFGRK